MTIHERHMELIDAVNNAKTRAEHQQAYWRLQGWRDGLRDCHREPDLIRADMEQFSRGFQDRPMCAGVFNDWEPPAQRPVQRSAEERDALGKLLWDGGNQP